jgi:hypothetical protein
LSLFICFFAAFKKPLLHPPWDEDARQALMESNTVLIKRIQKEIEALEAEIADRPRLKRRGL